MSLTGYIAVDPGRKCGYAEFAPFGRLGRCGLSKPPFTDIPRAPLLVIESPHGGRGKASRTDIATLARRMQMVIDHFSRDENGRATGVRVLEYSATRWKRTIAKPIMTRRIRDDWMSPEEREILARSRAPKNADVIDAIGLGIWYAAILGLREIDPGVYMRVALP